MTEMHVATERNIRGLHAHANAEITHFIAVLRQLQFQFPLQAVAMFAREQSTGNIDGDRMGVVGVVVGDWVLGTGQATISDFPN